MKHAKPSVCWMLKSALAGRCMAAWGIKPGITPTNDWAILLPGCQFPPHSVHTHDMNATLKQFHTLCCHSHTQLSRVWAQTPVVTLWHLLLPLIQSTFMKCFALLAPTVRTIMQMVKIGRESCAVAASAHSTQGSQPGRDQSSPSCSCLYSWGTISPQCKTFHQSIRLLISQYNTGWTQAEIPASRRNLVINDYEYNQL